MSKKIYLAGYVALIAISYLAGRFSAPEKITEVKKAETKVEAIQTQDAAIEKTGEKDETITSIVKPDGTRISRTRIRAHHESSEKINTATETKVDQKTEETKVIENRRGVVVLALVGFDKKPIYGTAFNKQVLGPINVGAFVFTDMRVGVSLGLEF